MDKGVETAFREAIFGQIDVLADASGWDIVAPNKNKPKDNSTLGSTEDPRYVVTIFPVKTDNFTTCGTGVWHEWEVQICVEVKTGDGELVALREVDNVVSFFPCLTELENGAYVFKQVSTPKPISALSGPAWYSVPVQFRYQLIN